MPIAGPILQGISHGRTFGRRHLDRRHDCQFRGRPTLQGDCQRADLTGLGAGNFYPQNAADLLQAVTKGPQKEILLWLCDEEATWGQFESLETFLRDNKIPYDRHSSGKYDLDAEIASYRPGDGLYVWPTNLEGEPVVAGSLLGKVEKKLAGFVESLRRGKIEPDRIIPRAEGILTQLRKTLPPKLPPLPPFTIGT